MRLDNVSTAELLLELTERFAPIVARQMPEPQQAAAPPAGHPLFALSNLLVTPHVAFRSQQSVLELEVRTAQATVDVLTGKMPQFLVNPAVLPHARVKLS